MKITSKSNQPKLTQTQKPIENDSSLFNTHYVINKPKKSPLKMPFIRERNEPKKRNSKISEENKLLNNFYIA